MPNQFLAVVDQMPFLNQLQLGQKLRIAIDHPNLLAQLGREVIQICQLLHPLKHQQSLLMHGAQVFEGLELIQAKFHLLALTPKLVQLLDQKFFSLSKDKLPLGKVCEATSEVENK
jgi:hypothetical protein